MNIEEIGQRIACARKALNYTQQQLADILNVSDKAVSKWERGIGCPDISLLLPLSEALHMTIDELISGVKEQSEQERNKTLQTMILYAKEKAIENRDKIYQIGYTIFSILAIVAVAVVGLVDYIVSDTFTWSLICITSIGYSWLIVTVLFLTKRNRWLKSIVMACIGIFPLLYVISLSPYVDSSYMKMAFPIATIADIYIIMMAWMWLKTNIDIWYKLSITFLCSLPVNVTANYLSMGWHLTMVLNIVTTVLVACVLAVIGYRKKKVG